MPRSFLVRKPSDPRRKPNYSELQDACVGAWRGAGRGQLGVGGSQGSGGENRALRARQVDLELRSWQLGSTEGVCGPGWGGSPSEDPKAGSPAESGWGRGGRRDPPPPLAPRKSAQLTPCCLFSFRRVHLPAALRPGPPAGRHPSARGPQPRRFAAHPHLGLSPGAPSAASCLGHPPAAGEPQGRRADLAVR